MKLLVATRNVDKVKEIKMLLQHLDIELYSCRDFEDLPEVIEDQDTIEGNAIKKAVETAQKTGMLTVSDDTGFFIEALNGAPGVFAARFAGEGCTYADNRKKVLSEMKGCANRSAYFKTVVALADAKGLITTRKGQVNGSITEEEFGNLGFGYDAIFRENQTGKTFGELSEEEKNQISHRALAFQAILPVIQELVTQKPNKE